MTAIATTEVDMKTLASAMLKENTGSNLIDSGGAYGRSWERNATRDFESERPTSVRFEFYDGKVRGYIGTISLYHWLTLNFEPDAEMQAKIDAESDDGWFEIAERVACEVSLDEAPRVTYTYNEPDRWDLSQDVQFWEVYTDGDYEPTHLILMVHNGCDARWGFTKPYALRIKGEENRWRDSARIDTIYAGDLVWTSDGGYGSAFTCEDHDDLDFFTLPFVDESELGDEHDEYAALIGRQKAALTSTTLSAEKQVAAAAALEAALEEHKNLQILKTLDDADVALLRKGDKLVALISGFEHEIKVGNCWL